jgi:Flp pilus assembly pilin Flp
MKKSGKVTRTSVVTNSRGQGLIEYLVIVALVAVATIGVVRVLGQAVNSRFATITYALQGKKAKPVGDAIPEEHLKKRDLSNFMDGVGSTGGEVFWMRLRRRPRWQRSGCCSVC